MFNNSDIPSKVSIVVLRCIQPAMSIIREITIFMDMTSGATLQRADKCNGCTERDSGKWSVCHRNAFDTGFLIITGKFGEQLY